jgi:hypothetical protein
MPNFNTSNTPRGRGVVTTLLNSATAATGTSVAPDSASTLVVASKTANTSAFSFVIQGSVDNVFWNTIGSAVTTAIGTAVAAPWPYLRVDMTSITNTAKTAASVTQTGGIATFTSNAHGFLVGEWVTVSGANEAGYNVSAVILTKDANTFTYAVAAGTVTPATGTVVANGNLRVYLAE